MIQGVSGAMPAWLPGGRSFSLRAWALGSPRLQYIPESVCTPGTWDLREGGRDACWGRGPAFLQEHVRHQVPRVPLWWSAPLTSLGTGKTSNTESGTGAETMSALLLRNPQAVGGGRLT